jgi:uncharacterized protein YukE
MAKIHMDTERVRNIARLLSNGANELEEDIARIRKSSARLSMAWYGGSRSQRFHSQLSGLVRQYELKARELQTLSIRVSREIDQWLEVDSNFGKSPGFWDRFWEKSKVWKPEDIIRLIATGAVISGMKPGTDYAGELIIMGARGLKEKAGMFPTLNHVRVDHLPDTLLKKAMKGVTPIEAGLAVIEFGGKAVEDWNKYDKGSEKAAAIGLDAAFVAAKTVGIHYAGYGAAAAVTFLLPLLIPAAPVVLVGAAGLAAWWAVSQFGGKALDAAWETYKDPLVKGGARLIDQAGYGINNAANFVADAAQQAAHKIDRGFNVFASKIASIFD